MVYRLSETIYGEHVRYCRCLIKHEEEIMMLTNPSKFASPVRWIKQSLLISIWLLVTLYPSSSPAFDILMGTGEAGSFSHFTGRTICRIINKNVDDLHCTVVPADNAVFNLTNLQGGSLDISLVDSRMLYDAIERKGSFTFFDISYDNLREMVTLYDIPMSLVVRQNAGITSLDSLKGKRVNAGAPHSSQHFVMDTIMGINNWSNKDFSLMEELPSSLSQDTMAFCHGAIQAMVHIGVHPDPSLQQLFRLCKARLINLGQDDMDKLLKSHPAFIRTEIAADAYPLLPGGVTTFGTRMKLVTSDSMDDKTVYDILDALYRERRYLNNAHPALGVLARTHSEKGDAGIKPHPGAIQFFNQQGL
jgi:uncharacterized protein